MPVLLDAAAQRFGVARKRGDLLLVARGTLAVQLVALTQVVAQVLDLRGELCDAVLALRQCRAGSFGRRDRFAYGSVASRDLLCRSRDFLRGRRRPLLGAG